MPNRAQIAAKAANVGSPAMAGSPTGTWLLPFMTSSESRCQHMIESGIRLLGPPPNVSFITIHWYKGPAASQFMSDIQATINNYSLPVCSSHFPFPHARQVWITEFAPQTVSSAVTAEGAPPMQRCLQMANATKYTQAQVSKFIQTVSALLYWVALPCVLPWRLDSAAAGATLAGSQPHGRQVRLARRQEWHILPIQY